MTTPALDYLSRFYTAAMNGRHITMTWVALQRPTSTTMPGIASFAYAPIGSGYNAGMSHGINFSHVIQVFSDRTTPGLGGVPQRFNFLAPDIMNVSIMLTTPGPALWVHSETWGGNWESTSVQLDAQSQQLLFDGPGAGPNAPASLIVIALARDEDHG